MYSKKQRGWERREMEEGRVRRRKKKEMTEARVRRRKGEERWRKQEKDKERRGIKWERRGKMEEVRLPVHRETREVFKVLKVE